MESSIKSLTITGSAAEDCKPRQGSRRRRKVSINNEDNDGFLEAAKKIVLSRESQETEHKEVIKPKIIIPEQFTKPITNIVQPIQRPVIQEIRKVILQPPKNLRVKLQPKVPIQPQRIPVHPTRKVRRITVANLSHRFTRANRVKDDTNKKPTDLIRKYLVERGVIQEKSKAPEKMLRSMYSDFMLLKDQAL